jgi:hypothetical protein
MSHVFLAHAWQKDDLGRCTHTRVRALRDALVAMGWSVWFDEDRLRVGDTIDVELVRGIRESDVILACVTRAYCDKLNLPYDRCAAEIICALQHGKKIVPVVMEPALLQTTRWPEGVAAMHLSRMLYFDASEDDMPGAARGLARALAQLSPRPAPRPAAPRRLTRAHTPPCRRGQWQIRI